MILEIERKTNIQVESDFINITVD